MKSTASARTGEPGNRAAVFVEHRRGLLQYAVSLVGEWAQAEDVVQDAYLRFSAASPFQPLEEPVGYLYRIVHNLALDRNRRSAREARIVERDVGQAENVPDERPSPEVMAIQSAEWRALAAALDELPERSRIALEMHRFAGSKLREIADHLGISTSTAHNLVADAIAHCRSRLLAHRRNVLNKNPALVRRSGRE